MIINEADTGDLIRLSQCNRLFHGLANQRVIFRKDVELLKQISDWESIDWERLFPDDDFEEEDSDRKRPLPGNHRQFALDNYKRGLYYEERIDNAHEEARSRACPWPICTPLLFCAVAGDVEFKVIRDIVDMYVDIWPEGLDEHQGVELLTPLQLATLGRRHDVMQLLLDRGATAIADLTLTMTRWWRRLQLTWRKTMTKARTSL
ncbi:hypothetical protein PG993_001056 [Apiospora rasikravindrae]|uniref:Ankyrin repeat protein n=1 Tax=Apiospora rasikravindrae TaxID=990691 RepID=A0ABR1UAA6_9PEZI